MRKGCVFGLVLSTVLILSGTESFAQWMRTNGPYGGQVNSVVSVAGDLFTCAGGTVFRSTNGGTAWSTTALTNAGVETIVNEGNKLVAVGSKVFVSQDEGAYWNVKGADVPWTNIQALGAGNSTIFASANNGVVSGPIYSLYRSTDDGASWTYASSGLGNNSVNSFAFNGDAQIYAGTAYGVFVSTNDGGSWNSAGLVNESISAITVVPTVTGGTYIFAGTRNGVFRSTNEGASWSSVGAGLSDTIVTALTIYQKAIGTPDILAGTQGGRVFTSNDYGDVWTDVSSGLISGPWEWGDWEADVSSLTVVESDFFACTNAGLFVSTDAGGEWQPADNGITNSLTINALAVTSSGNGTSIFAGSFPSGVFLSTDDGSHWWAVNDGINSIDIDELAISGKDIYAGGPTGVFLSTDNGASWDTVGLSNTGEVVSLLPATDLKGDTLILAGTWSGLFVSTNNGNTWDTTGLKGDVTALAEDSNGQGGINLFAGTRGSGIFISTDEGATWTSLHNGIPEIEDINALAFGGGKLFAATDYILYVSTDDGASWRPSGLNTSKISSNTSICSLAVDTSGVSGPYMFAGTNDDGVWVSTDGGTTWAAANRGLTDPCVYSLAISGPYLLAGTNVSGVWKRPLSELTAIHELSAGNVPGASHLSQNYPNPFNPPTEIGYRLRVSGFVTLKVYDALGREVATLVNGRESSGEHMVEFSGAGLASGAYFYRLIAGKHVIAKKMLLLK